VAGGGGKASAWRRLVRHQLAFGGLVVVALIVLLALLAPLLPLAPPNATTLGDRLLSPGSGGYLLGTDQLGRDLLSRLVWGARVSLAVAALGTGVAAGVGSLIGVVAAYYGKWVDTVLMRGIDMLMAFPYLLLALAIVAALGPGLANATIAIAVVNVPFFARTVRGASLSLTRQEFVAAARIAGMSDARIVFSELLPNVLSVIVVAMSTSIGWMILETAGLSFLGLGAQPPQADLGSMLGQGRYLMATAPHVSLVPGALILVLVVGLNLLGDGLRDVLDPKSAFLAGPRGAPPSVAAPQAGLEVPAAPAPEGEEPPEPLLAVDDLHTSFFVEDRVYRSVNGVSFRLDPGEAVGLVGESGSGKSVTSLSVLGLVPPPGRITGGSIVYRGSQLVGAPERELQALRGKGISYIAQDPMTSLDPLFRVGEQIVEGLVVHRDMDREEAWAKAVELLDAVQIPDPSARARAYPHELSGGMRQRVVIAMALANEPDLVIADEPTTALDVTTQAQVLELLRELRERRGGALLFITHDVGVVSQVCERILVLYAGKVVEAAATDELLERPRHPYTRRLLECVPRLGEPDRLLEGIPGHPPPVHDLPPGCAFAPRCPHAQDACREGTIPLERKGGAHWVRCVRADELEAAPAEAAS